MPLTIESLRKARESGLDDDRIVASIERNDPEMAQRFAKGREAGMDNRRILQAVERNISSKATKIPQKDDNVSMVPQNASDSPSQTSNTPPKLVNEQPTNSNAQPKSPGIYESFKAGIRGSSTNEVRKLLNGDLSDEPEVERDFVDSFSHSIGDLVGGAPAFAFGAAGGSAAGGVVAGPPGAIAGAGVGALAFDTFVKEALKEYRHHAQTGEDLTLGEFLERQERVAGSTLRAGAMGGILSAVTKMIPSLANGASKAQVKAFNESYIGKLLNTKAKQSATTATAEVGAMGSLPALSEGRLPTANEFAHAAALVFGMHIPRLTRIALAKEGRDSGLTPTEFATSGKAREIIEAAGLKPEVTKELKDIKATMSKPEATPEPTPEVKEPPKKSKKQTAEDLVVTKTLTNELPKSNKRNLANEAIKRGWVETPEQLDLFLDQYEAVYGTIPGKTGLSKNRKFMNRYAKDNLDVDYSIERTPERNLEIFRTQKRQGKASGDKSLQKDAQKRIDLEKRKLERNEKTTEKPAEESEVPKSEPETKADQKVETSKADLENSTTKPETKQSKEAKLRMPNMAFKIESPKEAKKPKEPKPITEETGQSAADRLESPLSKTERVKKSVNEISEAAKNPKEVLHQVYTKTFDALEPLNRLEKDIPTEERVSTKIKQSQNAASDINNILTQGVFDNVTNTFKSGSLKDAYVGAGEVWQKLTKDLKDQDYSIQEMDAYRGDKEALKRQKKGLKSGVDTKMATENVEKSKHKYGPIEQRIRKFQAGLLESYGKDLLTPETVDQWSQQMHTSLFRVMDYGNDGVVTQGSLAPKKPWYKAEGSTRKLIPGSESDIQNISMLVMNSKKNDSILQYKKHVESGQLPGKIVKSKNRAIPEGMMEALEIDPENAELAETLYNQSRKDAFTPETGRLRGWENGKPFEIEVPRDIYDMYSSFAPSDTSMATKIFKATNNIMSKGIVLEPIKFLSIFGRDAYSSLIYSRTGSNPISIMRALVDIYKGTHDWNQFKSLGGEQYASRLMTRTERVEKIETLLNAERPNAVMVPFKKLSSFLKKHSQNLTAAVPFAEYQRAVKKFGDTPSGRLQALIEAKSVTYDPTKQGSSKLIKGAANFFPFFNVMLQEPAMIAKHMKRPEFWVKGAIGMTLPSLLLHMYNDGNPDYDDMNPILKASCWHFYTDAGHFAVPIPWLLGALFKTTPELFYEYAKGRGGDAWKGLYSYVASQLSGSFPPIVQAAVEQSTGESLPSPVGLAMMPFSDVQKRAPPVVPRRLQNLPPEQQYTSKTSQLARWYGNMTGASPVKVERLAKTFGGNLASKALALVDQVAYWFGAADDLRPEQGAKNYLLAGQFLSENTPSNTKYTEKFYNALEQSKLDKKRGNDNKNKILNGYNTKISALFKKYREIEETKMNPSEKRAKMMDIQQKINGLYKQAVLKTQ